MLTMGMATPSIKNENDITEKYTVHNSLNPSNEAVVNGSQKTKILVWKLCWTTCCVLMHAKIVMFQQYQ